MEFCRIQIWSSYFLSFPYPSSVSLFAESGTISSRKRPLLMIYRYWEKLDRKQKRFVEQRWCAVEGKIPNLQSYSKRIHLIWPEHSIAGLLTARICSDHFEKVYIVEPESWLCTEDGKEVESWNQKNKRSRVMQYYSTHGRRPIVFVLSFRLTYHSSSGNLVPVTQCLARLFPEFEQECCRSGIRYVILIFLQAILLEFYC